MTCVLIEPRTDELHNDPPRIRWAAFLSGSISGVEQVLHGTKIITSMDLDRWLPRMTQVFMVEVAGAVVSLYTLAPRLRDRYVTMLIDADAVEAALIRGYSSQVDTADLVSIFLADHSRLQHRNVRVQDPHRYQP